MSGFLNFSPAFFVVAIAFLFATGTPPKNTNRYNVATDAIEEYKKIISKTGILENELHVTGTIGWRDQAAEGKGGQNIEFEVIKKGKVYYSRMASQKKFCDGEYVVQLDTTTVVIGIGKINKADFALFEDQSQLFNKLFADTLTHKLHATLNLGHEENVITIASESVPEIQSCQVYYNPKTYLLNHVEIKWWREKSSSEKFGDNVIVTDIKYNFIPFTGFEPTQTLKSVAMIANGNIALTEKYKSFSVQTIL